MISLRQKHIFIVGGSRGIGAGAAKLAAKSGARVGITYRAEKKAADDIVASIRAADGQASAYQADVTDEKALAAAVDASVKEFGPLHGLVVSAGVFECKPLDEMSLEFWNRTLSINLTGTFLSVKAAAKHLRTAGGASIVIYTSTAGQHGGAGASAYAATKAGQILFMKSMAAELAPSRIRVNCIAPAWTETDMAAASLDRLGREKVAKSFPLGRIGQVDDIANATLFLLSDMAEFITGSTVTVDGGIAMRG